MVVWQYHTSTSAVFPNISTLANVILILCRNFKLNELKDTVLCVFAQFCVMKIVSNKATAKPFCALPYWMCACFWTNGLREWFNDSVIKTSDLLPPTGGFSFYTYSIVLFLLCPNQMKRDAVIKGILSMLIWVFVVTSDSFLETVSIFWNNSRSWNNNIQTMTMLILRPDYELNLMLKVCNVSLNIILNNREKWCKILKKINK